MIRMYRNCSNFIDASSKQVVYTCSDFDPNGSDCLSRLSDYQARILTLSIHATVTVAQVTMTSI